MNELEGEREGGGQFRHNKSFLRNAVNSVTILTGVTWRKEGRIKVI